MDSVLVYGDIMLDTYEVVQPVKVSQEAPVLVCQTQRVTYTLGGAANAAQYCRQLGANTSLCGIVARDSTYGIIRNLIEAQQLHSVIFRCNDSWKTIEKKRIIDAATRHQIVRVDTEGTLVLKASTQQSIKRKLASVAAKHQTLLVSDYGKGTCHPDVLPYLIDQFRDAEKFVVINGKPQNLPLYTRANLVVMNAGEATEALGGRVMNLEDLPINLSTITHTDCLVTAGARGMWYYRQADTRCAHVSAVTPPGRVMDITGAGDMICASIATRGLVTPKSLEMAARNAAESITKGRVHC